MGAAVSVTAGHAIDGRANAQAPHRRVGVWASGADQPHAVQARQEDPALRLAPPAYDESLITASHGIRNVTVLKRLHRGALCCSLLLLTACAVQPPQPTAVEAPVSAKPERAAQVAVAAPGVPVLKRKVALGHVTNETQFGQSLLRDRNGDPWASRWASFGFGSQAAYDGTLNASGFGRYKGVMRRLAPSPAWPGPSALSAPSAWRTPRRWRYCPASAA